MLASGQEDLDTLGGISRSMIDWARMAFKLDGFKELVKIVIVGKYTGLQDSYLSVIKSLKVSLSMSLPCHRRSLLLLMPSCIANAQHSMQAWPLSES
jgi:hypothetical protein